MKAYKNIFCICLRTNILLSPLSIKKVLKDEQPKMAYIQRSRGYSTRPSLRICDIKEIIDAVKEVSPNSIIMVDNCYGEFAEMQEPCEIGADMAVSPLQAVILQVKKNLLKNVQCVLPALESVKKLVLHSVTAVSFIWDFSRRPMW